ncbi:MAG: response regulator [gamma proteobacterium symbiont of Lucinoma myriamae]|nr:response regulator [gamma proteobacterium symbiont of Lucinoma myriamae]MCU7832924.1 response regulator [gamma proteobacterium symbiont of Lucinoma myriamae]
MTQTILIVEDEHKIASLLEDYLRLEHFQTTIISDGLAVLPCFEAGNFDLILLDIMLPGKDGLSLCREIRQQSNVPIIIISARVEEIDRLLGLELGADDYICKPFSPREVVARVKAIFRRINAPVQHNNEHFKLEEKSNQIILNGQPVELTQVEFQLLKTMYSHPGQIYSRQQFIDRIYTDHRVVSERTVDSHIKKLRKKLLSISEGFDCIHSVYGVGYKYEAPSKS